MISLTFAPTNYANVNKSKSDDYQESLEKNSKVELKRHGLINQEWTSLAYHLMTEYNIIQPLKASQAQHLLLQWTASLQFVSILLPCHSCVDELNLSDMLQARLITVNKYPSSYSCIANIETCIENTGSYLELYSLYFIFFVTYE